MSVLFVFLSGSAFAAIAAGVIGGMFARQKARAESRKTDREAEKVSADAAETLARAALTLIEPYREQVSGFQGQIGELRTEVIGMRQDNAALREEVTVLRLENADLRNQLRTAQTDLGVLRRHERDSALTQARQAAVLTTLGVNVPDGPSTLSERTRAEDYSGGTYDPAGPGP